MSLDPTPISAIAGAVQSVVAMITKVLPTNEQELAYFQLHYPLKYQRLRIHIENRIFDQIIKDKPKILNEQTIINYVNWDDSDLPEAEQNSLVQILLDRFNLTKQ